MLFKIKYCGKDRYYESEKTFLRYYRKFMDERDRYIARHRIDLGMPKAFAINDNWSEISVLKGKR